MDLVEASDMAIELIERHLDGEWLFGWDNAVRRFGRCRHSRQEITISRKLTAMNNEETVRDVVLHEIAHAIAGHHAGHGPRWKNVCQQIGAKPDRCYDGDEVVVPTRKYTGVCPKCGQEFTRDRLSARLKANGGWCPCTGSTYRPEESLVWKINEQSFSKTLSR